MQIEKKQNTFERSLAHKLPISKFPRAIISWRNRYAAENWYQPYIPRYNLIGSTDQSLSSSNSATIPVHPYTTLLTYPPLPHTRKYHGA
jgi:hypothetical protein